MALGRRTAASWIVVAVLLFASAPVLAAVRGLAAGAAKGIGHAELPASAALAASPSDHLVADAARQSMPIYEAPNAPAPFKTLTNPTHEGVHLMFG